MIGNRGHLSPKQDGVMRTIITKDQQNNKNTAKRRFTHLALSVVPKDTSLHLPSSIKYNRAAPARRSFISSAQSSNVSNNEVTRRHHKRRSQFHATIMMSLSSSSIKNNPVASKGAAKAPLHFLYLVALCAIIVYSYDSVLDPYNGDGTTTGRRQMGTGSGKQPGKRVSSFVVFILMR